MTTQLKSSLHSKLSIILTAISIVTAAVFIYRSRPWSSDEMPIDFLDSQESWQEYRTTIKPWGSLFAAGQWGAENLTSNETEIHYVELGNESSSTERIGLELKSLGFNAHISQDSDSWLRVSAVPNTKGQLIARIVAQGAVYDLATDGATASCVTFDLFPMQLAKVPIRLAAQDIHGLTDETYSVLVKAGQELTCQTESSASGQTVATGLLMPGVGTELKLEALDLSGGRL